MRKIYDKDKAMETVAFAIDEAITDVPQITMDHINKEYMYIDIMFSGCSRRAARNKVLRVLRNAGLWADPLNPYTGIRLHVTCSKDVRRCRATLGILGGRNLQRTLNNNWNW